MNVEVIKEVKNKRGELKTRVSNITNKKNPNKGISFEDLNTLYKKLLKKYEAKYIKIVAQHLDGNWVTLKAFNYVGTDLKYVEEDYYNDLPKEVKSKLKGHYYSSNITILF